MRQILKDLQAETRARLAEADTPEGRARAIIAASFTPDTFDPVYVNAWMVLYVQSRTSDKARRLLRIYQRRLQSNLRHALRPISTQPHADAETIAALIDGMYLHQALGEAGSSESAVNMLRIQTGSRLT